MDKNTTIFNAQYYIEAQPFTSERSGKYGLLSVRIEPHETGVLVIASNGHILGVFHDAQASCKEAVTLKFSEEILGVLKISEWEKDRVLCLRLNGNDLDILEVHGNGAYWERSATLLATIAAQVATDPFPNWPLITPSKEATEGAPELWFNANYLKQCGEISDKWNSICVRGTGPNSQAVIRTEREDFFAVLMPIEETKPPVPESMRGLLKPKV